MSVSSNDPSDRRARVLSLYPSPEEVERRIRSIHDSLLASSTTVVTANFKAISVADLASLFDLYDRHFFEGLLGRSLDEDGARLGYRLSNRMTRSGGTTERLRPRSGPSTRVSYTITVSTFLLFRSFRDPLRRINVAGIECKDRLEALQRIFEHELLHLTEFLAWGDSSCERENFKTLSKRIFGHAGVKHELVTPHETAATSFGIRTGDRVAFEFEGVRRIGIVNRITKRATILVEDAGGRLFSNGVKYATFYVPLVLIRKVGDSEAASVAK